MTDFVFFSNKYSLITINSYQALSICCLSHACRDRDEQFLATLNL